MVSSVFVFSLVQREMTACCASKIAFGAGEPSLGRMNASVSGEMAIACAPKVTRLAHKRALARMGPLVHSEVATRSTTIRAQCAGEKTFSRMRALVFLQVRALFAPILAFVAREWPFATMRLTFAYRTLSLESDICFATIGISFICTFTNCSACFRHDSERIDTENSSPSRLF